MNCLGKDLGHLKVGLAGEESQVSKFWRTYFAIKQGCPSILDGLVFCRNDALKKKSCL